MIDDFPRGVPRVRVVFSRSRAFYTRYVFVFLSPFSPAAGGGGEAGEGVEVRRLVKTR